MLCPIAITQYGDWVPSRRIGIGGKDRSANRRFDPERFKESAGDRFRERLPRHSSGAASHADPDRKTSCCTDILEGIVLLFDLLIEIVRKYIQRARTNAVEFAGIRAISEGRELLGLSYRKRFQDQLVDQREDRRVRSNAQSKGNDGD